MRSAIITDIHGNLEALNAVLDDIEEAGVDRIVCLGDIVGYGADPQACVEVISGLVDKGAICIRGNHDDAVAAGVSGMSESAAKAMSWTQGQLDSTARTFLARLPIAEMDGDVLFVHASANDPQSWNYMLDPSDAFASWAATDARLTFCGHTHVPALFHTLSGALYTGKTLTFRPQPDVEVPLAPIRRYLAVIGSVGQPRDGNPSACWGLYDSDKSTLAWMRVPYDIDAAADKIKAAGLPDRLWMRLKAGK
ncbi:metallophosphoesterase family protein [Oryzibacter oryziterrae]|uniref:metallophosphoesterase family protein n=1 Tax=Oryzibacter oryziterrae TaxID=2766474 RepID=UPI001F23ED63|nr:metallophosphoesterase family protein [Oryzibacter oryziterrae]